MFLTNVIALCKLKGAKNGYSNNPDVEKPVESVENLLVLDGLETFCVLNIFVDFVKLFIIPSTET